MPLKRMLEPYNNVPYKHVTNLIEITDFLLLLFTKKFKKENACEKVLQNRLDNEMNFFSTF